MKTNTNINLFATQARARKAFKLADWLVAHGATGEAVATDAALRTQAVAATGVREPSLTTWAIVVTCVEHRQAHKVEGLVS